MYARGNLAERKKGNLARDLAIYLSRVMTGESGISLGRHFGISEAGVKVRHGRHHRRKNYKGPQIEKASQ